jgi:DNA-binding MarR family transcriptional regulator
MTLGMRAALELLLVGGPATVPRIARSRGVTRQHVQALVNGLLAQGLVALRPNPAHKRSPLVALSPAGETTLPPHEGPRGTPDGTDPHRCPQGRHPPGGEPRSSP